MRLRPVASFLEKPSLCLSGWRHIESVLHEKDRVEFSDGDGSHCAYGCAYRVVSVGCAAGSSLQFGNALYAGRFRFLQFVAVRLSGLLVPRSQGSIPARPIRLAGFPICGSCRTLAARTQASTDRTPSATGGVHGSYVSGERVNSSRRAGAASECVRRTTASAPRYCRRGRQRQAAAYNDPAV